MYAEYSAVCEMNILAFRHWIFQIDKIVLWRKLIHRYNKCVYYLHNGQHFENGIKFHSRIRRQILTTIIRMRHRHWLQIKKYHTKSNCSMHAVSTNVILSTSEFYLMKFKLFQWLIYCRSKYLYILYLIYVRLQLNAWLL